MGHVVGFGDRSTGRGIFGGEFGARHCNQWGLYGVCMYVCIKFMFAQQLTAYCHEGAMINCSLYRTFQSLSVSKTETVISSCRELSVVMSSTVLGQSTRNFVVHS